MPHLPPIEVDGGSVTIKMPVKEGAGDRIKQVDEFVHDPTEPADHRVTMNRYTDIEPDSRIYLIEIQGTPGSVSHKFTPNAGGVCSIKIHYLSGEEVRAKDIPVLPAGTTELG